MMDRAHSLRASSRELIFTGAGTSTGSRIPDFRRAGGMIETRASQFNPRERVGSLLLRKEELAK